MISHFKRKHINAYDLFYIMSQYTTALENTKHSSVYMDSAKESESKNEVLIGQLKELYIESLSPKEKKAYIIAKDHLGMSFTLEKSVGFLQWKNNFMK